MELFSLAGKTAIITGSSRGIGRAIAEAFADAGGNVVISSRKQDACDAVAAEINAKHGAQRALAVAANISSKEALQEMVGATRDAFGDIDILVCNAASNPHYGQMEGISDDQGTSTHDGAQDYRRCRASAWRRRRLRRFPTGR